MFSLRKNRRFRLRMKDSARAISWNFPLEFLGMEDIGDRRAAAAFNQINKSRKQNLDDRRVARSVAAGTDRGSPVVRPGQPGGGEGIGLVNRRN